MKFLSSNFWFSSRPGSLIPLYHNILIGIIILFISLTIFLAFSRKKKLTDLKLLDKLISFSSLNIFIPLILLFFNFELIPFFSSRFWYILWGVEMVIWLFFIFRYYKTIPEKRKEIEEKKAFNKYIP